MILSPCTYLPFFACPMHILSTLFIILFLRCWAEKTVGLHHSFCTRNRLGSFYVEKKRSHQAGAESLMKGNAGCPFSAFKLQLWPMSPSWVLILDPEEENPWHNLPLSTTCSKRTWCPPTLQQGSHWGLLCPGVAWPVSMWTNSWSWRPCIQVSPPLGQAFLVSWDGCTAAGSSVNTMGAISEILTSHSRAWHRHASCLLIYKNAPGWLACQLANLGVGVSGWYFADRCNLILCCELADAQSGACC